ncbi:MAG: hydrogenase iron-sulfur subunit [Dehalococcoidia bacterium]|nr:MAG: hydrogenase iron-sulfur subunit [Dehalococcoidia bacterium]
MLRKRADISPVKNFEPRILGFCCNWIACSGIKQAGTSETRYPVNLCLLPVTGSGIIQPDSILEAFAKSADGVSIAACPYYSKACPHHSGNYGT